MRKQIQPTLRETDQRLLHLLSPNLPVKEIEEYSQDALKEKLSEKRDLLKILKCFFPSSQEHSFIPHQVSINEKGDVSGHLLDEPFDNLLVSFIADPKERFGECLRDTIFNTHDDFDYEEECPDNEYLTEFNATNLGEYLNTLKELRIIEEDDIDWVKNHYPDTLSSPDLFHQFLLNFHQTLAIVSAAIEGQNKQKITNPTIQNILEGKNSEVTRSGIPRLMFDEMCIQHKRTPLSSEESSKRFNDDIAEKKNVSAIQIHYSETIGSWASRNQEDSFMIGNATSDNSQDLPKKLQNEFLELGREINNFQENEIANRQHLPSGSTAVVATYTTDQKLTIANCGDSRAVLFVRHLGDNKVDYIRLTDDHNPNSIIEKNRVESIGGKVLNGRVLVNADNPKCSGLSVSRSFGDSLFKAANREYSISHEPDIYQINVENIIAEKSQNTEEVQVFLCVSCDGAFEGNLNEATYAGYLETWFKNEDNTQEKWQGNIAEYIRDIALLHQSHDNVTLCFAEITEAPTKPVTIGVFDGHGGHKVSQTLAVEFGKALLEENNEKLIHPATALSILPSREAMEDESDVDTQVDEDEEYLDCSDDENEEMGKKEVSKKRSLSDDKLEVALVLHDEDKTPKPNPQKKQKNTSDDSETPETINATPLIGNDGATASH